VLFAVCLGQQGLAHSTIKTYLSGVRQLQIAHGGTDPDIDKMPRVQQVHRGVKAECGKQGKSCSRLPITPGILRKIKMSWTGRDLSFDSVMLWAAALTTFFFCRSGEIMVDNEQRYDLTRQFSWGDVAADDALSPSIVSLNIKISKGEWVAKWSLENQR